MIKIRGFFLVVSGKSLTFAANLVVSGKSLTFAANLNILLPR